jgi:hypothetical protein
VEKVAVTDHQVLRIRREAAFRLRLGWMVGEKKKHSFAVIRFRYFHSKEIESPKVADSYLS